MHNEHGLALVAFSFSVVKGKEEKRNLGTEMGDGFLLGARAGTDSAAGEERLVATCGGIR